MSTTESPQDVAKRIREKFTDEYSDYSLDEMADRVTLFQNAQVPQNELERSVIGLTADDLGITSNELLGKGSSGDGDGEVMTVKLADIESVHTDDGTLVNVEAVMVDQLWEPRSDKIAQVGLVGDESGRTKFVSFTTSELPEIEEGKAYKLDSVWTDEYEGNYSIKLASNTTITEIDEDVEVGDGSTTFTGVLVNMQQGSGLIERCSEEDCTRVLKNSRCSEHGDVESEDDLRIKAWVDNGTGVKNVIMGSELTTDVTGVTLDDALELAMDALDKGAVGESMADRLVGYYYAIEGVDRGTYFIANEVEVIDEFDSEEFDIENLRTRVEEVEA